MKNDKIDFDELKRGMDSFTSNKVVKIAVATGLTIAGIYVFGKVMKLFAISVSEYKQLKGALNAPPTPPKNPT